MRHASWKELGLALAAAFVAAGASCSDAATGPALAPELRFEPPLLDLGTGRSATVRVRNSSTGSVGPVEVLDAGVRGPAGDRVEGARLVAEPRRVASLPPGGDVVVALELDLPADLPTGDYTADLEARVAGQPAARLEVAFALRPGGGEVATVAITGGPVEPRQGDVVRYEAEARGPGGEPVAGADVRWNVLPASAGSVDAGGRFVGYEPGAARLVASADEAADTLELRIVPRGLSSGSFRTLAAGGLTSRFTSDLWIHGGAGYTGTWGFRGSGATQTVGDRLYVWDLADPARPVLTDSVIAEGATVVNDVKVSPDGRLGVATIEFSSQNGILLLDLSDALRPRVLQRFSPPELATGSGVHNTWIDGDHVYAVTFRLVVVEVADPARPQVVSTWFGGSSFLHDVVVREGLAFLSHWDLGLVILDVGAGLAGGSPASPVEVGRIDVPGYQLHNAWYWPEAGYVFLGDEVAIPGVMRVIDVRDPSDPVAVASFTVQGAAPHNFWLDEARGVLYMAWYENGVIALDVGGELMGELELQGRELARFRYAGAGRCPFNEDSGSETCAFAPQLEGGILYVADMNSGLWALRPEF